MEQRTLLGNSFYEHLDPPPELTISEWADKYRVLTSEASSEPGPWRTDRFPFTKEIMDICSPQDPTKEIVMMKAAQVAWTEIMLNIMGYTIHYDPQPLLYIQKTIQAVERFSAQRFSKSLEATPEILERLPKQKSRDDSNTKTLKNFPGGLIILGGANSAASLRSMPISRLLLDELDSFEHDIQEEGDPIDLAIRRTSNFPRRKIFYGSTPLVKETSRIERLFNEGDQRYYRIPCPFCGQMQTMKWGNINFIDKDPRTAKLKCEGCAALIDERYKTEMLANGYWEAMHPGRVMASFFINSFYSPLGFYSWADAVTLWLKYRKSRDQEILRVFVNTVLGETYSEAGKSLELDSMEAKKEKYVCDVPEKVLVLTAGVDVQEDRVEAEIVGWGEGQESWSIDYKIIMGDPEKDDVWMQLDDYLVKRWKHTSGASLFPACVAVDSGHKARIVYNFCKRREFRRVFPIKGTSGWGKGLIGRPVRRLKDGVYLFQAFVDELKSRIYSQLKIDSIGPGYCHFPNKLVYDNNYFRMLVAEKLLRKRVGHQYKMIWDLPAGRRNEALDCRCYAIAALNILSPDFEAIKRRGTPMNLSGGSVKKRRVLSKGIQV